MNPLLELAQHAMSSQVFLDFGGFLQFFFAPTMLMLGDESSLMVYAAIFIFAVWCYLPMMSGVASLVNRRAPAVATSKPGKVAIHMVSMKMSVFASCFVWYGILLGISLLFDGGRNEIARQHDADTALRQEIRQKIARLQEKPVTVSMTAKKTGAHVAVTFSTPSQRVDGIFVAGESVTFQVPWSKAVQFSQDQRFSAYSPNFSIVAVR